MLIFLEHDYPSSLAHDEAVAVAVVRPAGLLRLIVEVGAERTRLGESGDADRADRRLGAAREHDVGVVVADHPRRVAYGVSAGRAGGHDRVVGAHQPVLDRHLAGDEVDQSPMDEMRADTARALLVKYEAFALDAGKPADARADRHTRSQLGRLVHVGEPGILHRLARGIEPEDDEGVHLALDLVVNALGRVETIFVIGRFDLARDAAFLVARVEMGDRPGAAFRRDDILPAGLDVTAERSDEAKTSDDYSAHSNLQKHRQAQTRSGLSLWKPCNFLERSKEGNASPSTSSEPTAAEKSALILVDIFDGIANGRDLLRGVIRDFDPELLFEGHHELDNVEAVRTEIIDEARVFGHLVRLDAEMFDDDLLHPIGSLAHGKLPPLCFC